MKKTLIICAGRWPYHGDVAHLHLQYTQQWLPRWRDNHVAHGGVPRFACLWEPPAADVVWGGRGREKLPLPDSLQR